MSTYTVVKGDTLFAIAAKFGMTVTDLKSLNGLKDNALKVGQILKVRAKDTPKPPAPTTPAPKPAPASGGTTTAGARSYTVVKGDTLSGISKRFGTTVDALKILNKLKSTALSIGQVLKIPGAVPANPPVVPPPVVSPPAPPPVVAPNPAPGDYLAARRQFTLITRPDAGFQRFELAVPLLNGTTVIARMRDNVTYSAFMKYPEGVLYGGQSAIHVPVERVESVGLNTKQAAALEYVSSHEGKYDAINSYDGGIFSFGSIQFVGASEHGASLNRVLAGMKINAPARFAQVFQQVGIDVAGNVVTVLDETGRVLSGDLAWLYIQKTLPLYGAFMRAANDLYVQPALNFRLKLTINGISITVPRLRDILTSEGLLTALIAIAINRGTGAMSRIVADALTAVATPLRLHDMEALRQVDERILCQTIADTTTDTRTRDRAQGVLNAGLNFAKT
jgi:LysM repeat protein